MPPRERILKAQFRVLLAVGDARFTGPLRNVTPQWNRALPTVKQKYLVYQGFHQEVAATFVKKRARRKGTSRSR